MFIVLIMMAQFAMPLEVRAQAMAVSSAGEELFSWKTLGTLKFWIKVAEVLVRVAIRQQGQEAS